MSQPSAPPPWPPRPIFLAHFLHPPGGSLHYSVPESSFCSDSTLGAVTRGLADPLGRVTSGISGRLRNVERRFLFVLRPAAMCPDVQPWQYSLQRSATQRREALLCCLAISGVQPADGKVSHPKQLMPGPVYIVPMPPTA